MRCSTLTPISYRVSLPASVRVLLLFWCICFPLALLAHAQDTVTGAFEGTVTNSQTGAPIAGASAQIINQQTGQVYDRTSDTLGRFYQGLLNPGVYTIRVSAPGFQTAEVIQRLFISKTGEVVPVPVSLDPEQPSAVTPANPTAPATTPTPNPASRLTEKDTDIRARINTSDAQRGGAFTEEEVTTLPLGATTIVRTFDELALLLPGVAPPPQTIGNGSGPGVGAGVGSAGQFSVNGLRSRANNFTVDGSDNNDEDIGVRRQGFLALIPQPIESVKEYQVTTLLAPAQFGRNIGAQVNAVSSSGGNETHGTLYGLFNSSQLNARNVFDTTNGNATTALRAGGKPVLLANQPLTVRNQSAGEDSLTLGVGGFVLGGPVAPLNAVKPGNSMFYFISAEGQLLNATKESSFAVPTVEQRGLFNSGATGIARDPFNNNPVVSFPATVTGDALFSLFPFPNNPQGVYGANTLTQVLPAGGQGKVLSGKFDGNFKLRQRPQSFTARYNFTDDYRDIPATGGALFSTLRPRVRTQNFSTFLNSELSAPGATTLLFNQVRASYGRTRLAFDEVRDAALLPPTTLGSGLRPEERKFLVNSRLLVNNTLPGFNSVTYDRLFNLTVEDILGPLGQVAIAGFSPVGVDVFNFPQRRVNNTYQLADDLTVRAGRHTFVFGVDTRRTELNSDLPRNARRLITFNGAPRLVSGAQGQSEFRGFYNPIDLAAAAAPSGVFQAVTPGSGSAINLRYYQYNYFAQDEWRVRPNLSLSFGLRYEYNSPPREVNGRIENTFNDPALGLVPGLRTFLAGRSKIFDPDRNNFAPRVGFAYAPRLFGGGRSTVLRAGYGMFYDQALGAVVSQSRNVFPNFLTLNFAGGFPSELGLSFNITDPTLPFFPCRDDNGGVRFLPVTQPGTLNTLNRALPLRCLVAINNSFPGGFGFTLPAKSLETPAAQHYTFTVEQQLHPSLVVSAAYVGTQGRHLLRLTTPNLGPNAFLIPTVVNVFGNQPNVSGVALGPGQRVAANNAIVGGRP